MKSIFFCPQTPRVPRGSGNLYIPPPPSPRGNRVWGLLGDSSSGLRMWADWGSSSCWMLKNTTYCAARKSSTVHTLLWGDLNCSRNLMSLSLALASQRLRSWIKPVSQILRYRMPMYHSRNSDWVCQDDYGLEGCVYQRKYNLLIFYLDCCPQKWCLTSKSATQFWDPTTYICLSMWEGLINFYSRQYDVQFWVHLWLQPKYGLEYPLVCIQSWWRRPHDRSVTSSPHERGFYMR